MYIYVGTKDANPRFGVEPGSGYIASLSFNRSGSWQKADAENPLVVASMPQFQVQQLRCYHCDFAIKRWCRCY